MEPILNHSSLAQIKFTPSVDKVEVNRLINNIFATYSIPISLISYCKASIIPIKESKMLKIKFPLDSAYESLSNYKKFYFKPNFNNECSITDALFGNEILFNGDISYEDKTINSSNTVLCSDKQVILQKRIPYRVCLIVLVKYGTYRDSNDCIVLERKGSHVIVGLIVKISSRELNFKKNFSWISEKIKVLKQTSFINYYSLSSNYDCPYQSECYKYLCSQDFKFKYFDNSGNRCYCSVCFPNNWINSQEIANERYIIPRGWCRFGLKVPFVYSQLNNIWEDWCNVFHGTNPSAAKSIIEHKTLLLHGDILKNGNRLGKKCSAEEWGFYYTSPHICYASHPWYSNIIKLPISNGENKYAQVVLAIKIRYNSYSKQPETEGGAKKIFDDYTIIPENEIEWFSKRRGCTVPYGVLVRIFGDKEKVDIERLAPPKNNIS